MTQSLVQVVDESGETIGTMEKLAAHENGGTWHRAISVFLVDVHGRALVQKRAASKYHFAGYWANACCSHPSPTESVLEAGQRALRTELGISCDLTEVGVLRYEATDPLTGLTEREHDHVLVGVCRELICIDPAEITIALWLDAPQLQAFLHDGEPIAPWLPKVLQQLISTRPDIPPLNAFLTLFGSAPA